MEIQEIIDNRILIAARNSNKNIQLSRYIYIKKTSYVIVLMSVNLN
jgi:hypothetical protein